MVDLLKTSHVAAAAAVVFAAFATWIVGGFSHGTALKAIDDIVSVLLSVPAVFLAAMAARSSAGRLRAAWTAMAVGLLGWAIGDMLWAYYELALDEVPFPSLADAAYLVMPVAFCVALLLFPVGNSAQSRGRMLLDGLIVAGSLFLASWVMILNPMYQAGADSLQALIISLAYPVSDVVILTIAAIALVRVTQDQRLVLSLLTVGIACIALSDSAFAYLSLDNEYSSGNLIDIGYVAGLLMIMVAAAAGREGAHRPQAPVELPGWASIWFPYAPLLLVGIVAAAEPPATFQAPLVQIVGAILIVTVLARQFLSVSENRRLLEVVAEQARRDPLTGLANRAMFSERLNQAMLQRQHDGTPVSLIALDLNDFKLVNDALGHPAGDELLSRVGERILGCVRDGDTVARLGGDEFVVLTDGDTEASQLIARRVAESFDKPFVIETRDLYIRPSIGLAVAGVAEPALTAEDLLKRADVAMYSAKKARSAEVNTFSPDLAHTDPQDYEMLSRLGAVTAASESRTAPVLAELRKAIDQFELMLLYQPKVDLQTSRIVGIEALVRWPHPERGLLDPDEFLPMVRRSGLMGSLTDAVVNMALDDALTFKQASFEVPIAVNVSAPLFADARLPARIARALADRGLTGTALSLEITEDLLFGNMERSRDVLDQLRRNGIRIAIDDFGSGYSTLSYLCELHVDEVKLDRLLVAPVLDDARVATVVRTIIGLARELGLTTVAEGIENAEVARRLADFGCDVGQGFFFSAPVPADEALRLLHDTRRIPDHSAGV